MKKLLTMLLIAAISFGCVPTTFATPAPQSQHLKKDGTPDKRYKANKHLKKDGTPDKRFKENKKKKS